MEPPGAETPPSEGPTGLAALSREELMKIILEQQGKLHEYQVANGAKKRKHGAISTGTKPGSEARFDYFLYLPIRPNHAT